MGSSQSSVSIAQAASGWTVPDGGRNRPFSFDARRPSCSKQLSACFEPVWCSGWEEKADEYLPAALGLPAGLPHLSFDHARAAGDPPRHWKLAAIDAFAGPQRPLAWVDDAHDDTCHAWADARPGATLLVATQPAVGLTAGHVAELLDVAARPAEPRELAQVVVP